MPAPKSQAQARFFGALAGGDIKKPGFSMDEAKDRLRGVKVRNLPPSAGKGALYKMRGM